MDSNSICYKYYSESDYNFEALEEKYFFFCKVSKQNDPYDSSFKLMQSENVLNALKGKINTNAETIMKDYGTCSFTDSKENKRMWASYANNYNGFCIGFDDSTFQTITKKLAARVPYIKVNYVDAPITLENDLNSFVVEELFTDVAHKGESFYLCAESNDPKKNEDLFLYICSMKEKKSWDIENETRLVAGSDIMRCRNRLKKNDVVYEEKGYKIPMPDGCVKEIILGHNMSDENVERMKSIARKHGIDTIYKTKVEIPFETGFEAILVN